MKQNLFKPLTAALFLGSSLITEPAALAIIEVDADGGASLEINGFATNAPTLQVGINYSDNSLLVTNDGSITVDQAYIGSPASDQNTALVTGSGSYIQATSAMEVGDQNTVGVEDGAWIYVGDQGTNNPAGGGIRVGNAAGDATLTIGAGTQMDAANLLIGIGTNETGSMSAAGADSLLNLSEDLLLGTGGSDNTLTVDDGAGIAVGNNFQLGSTNGVNNRLYISNGGSVSISGSTTITDVSNNAIHVNSGGHLGITEGFDLDTMTNGIIVSTGASLQIGGTLQTESLDKDIDITLNGPGASWTTTDHMYIGNETSENVLVVQDGAGITSGAGKHVYIGFDSDDNQLTIKGTNSHMAAQEVIFVGSAGSDNTFTVEDTAEADTVALVIGGNSASAVRNKAYVRSGGWITSQTNVIIGIKGSNNQLNIEDGGTLDARADLILGRETGADGNALYLSGSNSVLDVAGHVVVGNNGTDSEFTVEQGQAIVAGDFTIGAETNATGVSYDYTGNVATVGENAILDIGQNLTVGREGGGSIMLIQDGGTVNVFGDTVIGEAVGDNYIFLEPDNADSRFNVTGDLIVGVEGGDTRFAIYGGTANISENLYLGASTNQHAKKNYIHLETTNAVLNVTKALHIGASNSVNTLDVVMGAEASVQDLFVGAYDGVTNNGVTVRGENNYGEYVPGSLLSISNKLVIGSDSGSNNTVTVNDGGTLYVSAQTNMVINGTNNTLTITDQGTLKTGGWDFDLHTGQATNIVFESGSTLHLLGALAGTNMVEGEFNVVLDGDDAGWAVAENMFVGNETGNNSLSLTNGATATVSSNLYIGFDASDNAVTVGGLDSMLSITNNLQLGADIGQPQQNAFTLLDGARAWVGNDVSVFVGSTVKIDSESQLMVDGDYIQDQYSTLEIGVSSNQVNPNLLVEGDVGFGSSYSPGNHEILKIFNDGVSESNTVTIVQAGTISLDGEEASAGTIEGSISTNSLLGFTVIITNDADYSYIVLDNFTVRTIGDAGGLDGQLLDVADEIEWMYTNGIASATNMLRIIEDMDEDEINTAFNDYFGATQSSIPANTVLSLGIQNVAEQLTVRADNTRARMGAATASTERNRPSGAAGPHQAGQQLQGWIAGYGSRGTQDASDGFSGYDASLYGFLIGVDLSVAENILVGVAGGTGSSSVDKNNGGTSDLKTRYASVYASMGTEDWFGDASMIYGGSSVDSVLGSAFDTTASYDAQNLAFYLGGGKEIINEYLIITPQASLLANYYKQDDYQEYSSGVGRSVESFNTLYVQSSLGCNLGFYTGMGETTLKTEVRAHWLHEFNGDEESVSYQMIGGDGSTHTLFMQAPESDILKLGAGIAAKVSEHIELRLDLDTRQSKNYSDYTALGSLRYQF